MFLADMNVDGSSGVSGTAGLYADGQADFRSILSYGVQEPWVKPSAPSPLLQYVSIAYPDDSSAFGS